MSRCDTNYILLYKTNIEVVTKAHMGLNHSVYVALCLNLKCPGVTQNYELINLVKNLHTKARTGSQMYVVTVYAHTISHI